jgi:hypothetical protein
MTPGGLERVAAGNPARRRARLGGLSSDLKL